MNQQKSALQLAWLISLIATLSSLYFSEIKHLVPCILCWYQRICMYPLVFILTTGILLNDWRVSYYVLPLSLIGLGISGYHSLLHLGVISEKFAPCSFGVSCTTKYVVIWGLTIPMLSFIAFLAITLISVYVLRLNKHD